VTESDAGWPASGYAISAAREQFRDWGARKARVLVAPHGDVDGLAAAAIVIRVLERLGATPLTTLPGKGEHVHLPAMRARLAAAGGDGLIVLDMGTRRGPIVEGLPTIVLDHHDAHEVPDGVIFVSAAGREPVTPTGLLAYLVTRELVASDDLRWLALLATVGDLGMQHPFTELADIAVRKTHVQKTVSLINAARRAPEYKPELALSVLLAARGPHEIARGTVDGVDELEACRRAVQDEVTRVARVAPKVVDGVALIRFSSAAQIHPLIATRWAGRLAPKIVIAANDGYLPDRVNFAMRSASRTDLLAYLRSLGLGAVEGEFANGHPRATGGSVPRHEFDRLLRAIGY
jgi:single-stranded-DNA-specific exonuclease